MNALDVALMVTIPWLYVYCARGEDNSNELNYVEYACMIKIWWWILICILLRLHMYMHSLGQEAMIGTSIGIIDLSQT